MDRDTATRVAEALKRAIEAEQSGYHFYQTAARTTSDEQGRQVFEQLALEELDHARYLRAHYQSLLEKGTLDPSAHLGRRTDLKGDSPIFSPQLKTRAGGAHFEMSALSIGVQLELNAVTHYQAQADATTEPSLQAFFRELVEWESGHYEALNRQLEDLREAYWDENRFSPF